MMTKNNKGRAPGKDATPKTSDSRNHTATDPQLGRVDTCLAGQLALLAVLFVLLVCGVKA
ncbi:hypothetical protein [Propionivibrio limicola]|uniref:hypothetical protein n=1 Tax=Propionivibrio limicola TaxID=167645 RepID=UPI0014780C17|nr:hypothetical protein [Propionivibrio limicola]